MINSVFPALTAVDSLFASYASALVRILAWGAAAGALAMLVYRLASNQNAITQLKAETRELRRRMLDPDLEQSEFARLIRKNLKTSFKLLGKTLLPAMLSAIPVLLIATWMDAFYGYALPPDGEAVRVHVEPRDVPLAIEPADRVARTAGNDFIVTPLMAGETLTVTASGAVAYVGNPFVPPASVVAKRQWWNALLASETGYVKPGASIDRIFIDLPRRHLIDSLPDWLAGWEAPYFLAILVVALALKFGLKIE
jgi:hypothetical protein